MGEQKLLIFWKINALGPKACLNDQGVILVGIRPILYCCKHLAFTMTVLWGGNWWWIRMGLFQIICQNSWANCFCFLVTDESQFKGDTISVPIDVKKKKWGWFLPWNPWYKSKLISSWKIKPQGTCLSTRYTTTHKGSLCTLEASWGLV